MALKGIKVIDVGTLIAVPYCASILADFGATVIKVDRTGVNQNTDNLSNGKKSIALNLKHRKGAEILHELCNQSDVLIEAFRPGVMEKLGLGPDVLLKDNPRLIHSRLTGFGQNGLYSGKPGHELNFIGLNGLLTLSGIIQRSVPMLPVGFGTMSGGSLVCALGIILALLERKSSGLGQIVDCSTAEGTAYLGSVFYRNVETSQWPKTLIQNVLDERSHFYDVYETKDGRHMAVDAVEPEFYANFVKGLGSTLEELPQSGDSEKLKTIIQAKFREKTQKEWCEIFDSLDACVTPVMTLQDTASNPHNIERKTFTRVRGIDVPNPAPKLSRTLGTLNFVKPRPEIGENTEEILGSLGYGDSDIQKLIEEGTVKVSPRS